MFLFKRNNIATFEKVSYYQFQKDYRNLFFKEGENNNIAKFGAKPSKLYNYNYDEIDDIILEAYNNIKIPQIKTEGSAGHDFCMPFDLELDRNNSAAGISLYNTAEEVIIPKNIIIIPTGIKVCIDKGWILEIFPRSSYGTKGLIIKNTVGIIDQDYYNNEDNEGHILLKIENTGNTKLLFKGGESYFSQGLFMIYGTAGKQSNNKRNGGFGSTSILSSQVYK